MRAVSGWALGSGASSVSIFVGHLPGRKQQAVYVLKGSVLTVLAYCTSDEHADELAAIHDRLATHWTERGGAG